MQISIWHTLLLMMRRISILRTISLKQVLMNLSLTVNAVQKEKTGVDLPPLFYNISATLAFFA